MKALFIFFLGLLMIIGIVYGALIYVKGEQQKVLAELAANDSTFTIEKPLSEADSLRKLIEKKEQEIVKKETIVDSIKNDAKTKIEVAKIEAIETATKIAEENEAKAKKEKALSMAKTFEKMSIKQIAPILNNLDDETVMMIYTNTGNRFKKNILLAVNEKRAAQITKEFINN
jgi:flagellar motility protein MotE (MotC chaperone)